MSDEQRMGEHWDAYPAGMKVLAVDDDPLCLKVVAEMLRRCDYEVMTAPNGKIALEKLRDKSAQYDLVLSDVYMPDMDGFKLLELIGLELDLPVIMMSSNGETQVVLRGVTHGAVDYLIKPVRIEELRNVWQHVVRRRREHGGPLQAQNSREYSGEDGEVVDGSRSDKKRKESPSQGRRDGQEDTASAKKPRVVWSVEMHQQFVNAVNTLGIDKAVPKRILDQMQVEGLTRENVASHLQKYRLYLKRVAGVQLTPSGRGKASRSGSLDAAGYSMMGMQAPLSMMPQGSLGSLDQEQLRMSLQMAHLRNQQAAMGGAQAEGYQGMPLLQARPVANGTGLHTSSYGAVTQPQSVNSSTAHHVMPMEELTGPMGSRGAGVGPGSNPGMLGMHADNFVGDSGAMGLGPDPHQVYDMGLQLPHEHDLYQSQLLQQQQQQQCAHLHRGQDGMGLAPAHSSHDENGINAQSEGDMNDLYISFLQDQ